MAQAARPKSIDASQVLNEQAFTIFLILWEMKTLGHDSIAWRNIRRFKSLNGIAASPDQWDQGARVLMRTGLAAAIGIDTEERGYRLALTPLATTLLSRDALVNVGRKMFGLSAADATSLIDTITKLIAAKKK